MYGRSRLEQLVNLDVEMMLFVCWGPEQYILNKLGVGRISMRTQHPFDCVNIANIHTQWLVHRFCCGYVIYQII